MRVISSPASRSPFRNLRTETHWVSPMREIIAAGRRVPEVQLTTACRNPVTDTRFGTVSRVELGYARVPATKQDLDRQIDALTVAGIASGHIYVDKKSGATTDRPGLKALLDYARPGDVIVVHTLDRLGRTVRDTLNLIHQLRERGVGVRNLADPIRVDSASPDDPMAQLAVVLLALFAQMERTYTLERAAHARAVATAKGRRVGRPSVVTESQLVHAVQLRRDGRTIAEITAATGLTRATLYRHLPAREPEPVTVAPSTTGELARRSPASFASRLACPSCGHQPAERPPDLGDNPPAPRWTGYASTAGKPTLTCCARSRSLITDHALVCGW